MAKVAIIMGSQSDLPALEGALRLLKQFSVGVEVHVLSAHRTPYEAAAFASKAREEGFEVIIAAAGKAAHLPGVLAAYTTLPVIGLPIKSSYQDGADSLLSIVQMPSGVPVATVGVQAGENAALLAVQILGVKYPDLAEALSAYKDAMHANVLKQDAQVQAAVADILK